MQLPLLLAFFFPPFFFESFSWEILHQIKLLNFFLFIYFSIIFWRRLRCCSLWRWCKCSVIYYAGEGEGRGNLWWQALEKVQWWRLQREKNDSIKLCRKNRKSIKKKFLLQNQKVFHFSKLHITSDEKYILPTCCYCNSVANIVEMNKLCKRQRQDK